MEVSEEQLQRMIQESVDKSINRKLDRLENKVDSHMEQIEPFIDGWDAARTVTTWIKWLAGFIIAVSAAIFAIKELFFN